MARLTPLLILGAAGLCGCAGDDPMAITDVIADIDALNGRSVRVAGYLGPCQGYDCLLFRNEREKARWDRYIAEVMALIHDRRRGRAATAEPPILGIGTGENRGFDRMAAPYTNSYVVITGRVSNRCRHNGQPACTDRTTDLEPTAIEGWQPPANRPAGSATQ